MKARTKVYISSLLIVPVLSFGTILVNNLQVAAEDSTSDSGSSSSQSSTQTETNTSNDSKLTLQQRLEKRKAEVKVTLPAADKLRVQAKCAGAQGIIKSVKNRSAAAETARTNVYKRLDTKLGDLITKLKAANVDTTKLASERTTLEDKIKTFNTDLAAFKLAVNDLSTMDCKTDPEAFKAALQDARTLREKLKTDATDIRTYVKDTIKPTLQEIRTTLAAKKSSTSSSEEGSDQ